MGVLSLIKRRQMVLYFNAKIEAVKMLTVMLKKRRSNMKAKRISNKDLREIMVPGLEWGFLKNKLRSLIFG